MKFLKAKFLQRAAFAGAVRGLLALFVLPLLVSTTHAAEIKVLSGMGMRAILTDLTADFERTTGHKLNIVYDTAGLVKDRIRNGEPADVAVMQRYLLEELLQQSKLVRGTAADIARSPVGLGGRASGRKPDIRSVEALKQALLEAESISYTDPAAGGLSGTHFARVLELLGIAEQMKPKTLLGRPSSRVMNGEAEFAILQVSEILPLPGVQLVGRFPEELQENSPVSAAVISGAHQPEAGMAFIRFLRSAVAARVLTASGMEPIEQK